MPYNKGKRRKLENSVSVVEPPSKSFKVTLLNPSVLLLEIPADTNTSLPVWEAIKSQQIHVSWTVDPYNVTVQLNPVISKKSNTATSGESENTSNVAQTSTPSTGSLQHHMALRSITQQQDVVLTFLSPPGDPQKVRPNPTPADSLTVSLPLLITPQPSTSTKESLLPIKLQAASKVPALSEFHTKGSSDIRICEKFLLNVCRAGKGCKMHHTPYPFHWQLWSLTEQNWVDFPAKCHVLVERIYCNVNQEYVAIKSGSGFYNVFFDLMVVAPQLNSSHSTHRKVRRLSNTDSTTGNPRFATKWKIYWWDNHSWKEYNEDVSTHLLRKMHEKEPECSFHIGTQQYKLDFTTMTQINVNTKFMRNVRCRPVYQSPESMNLQTRIQTDSTSGPPAANFSVDPLEEFSSWYPPVWCSAPEQDYTLVDVPPGTQAYSSVQKLFFETMDETEVHIVSILQIQNVLHWDKYQRHKAFMQKRHTESEGPLERHLFHGTTKDASKAICQNNFDPRLAGVNGTRCGFGSYFATTACYSDHFSDGGWAEPDEVRRMFLAKVLVGKVSLGQTTYRRPPPFKNYRLYDSCVDDLLEPTMFAVFDPCQCYPYYMIKYKNLDNEVEL
ncbi:TCDD-inducible poly [ADP-ribose] polymerase [Collichthys lucidus]|uniref:TCDD-inducible poly [ADP-ribose] polymerase n=1 Tax=Collichthys lucidus TaxID=240159 RepID=A0A4U5VPT0_COLLU|nr:TCDD-inducible poly [ADP-ribose] polymerase [Collichthys lucidus]